MCQQQHAPAATRADVQHVSRLETCALQANLDQNVRDQLKKQLDTHVENIAFALPASNNGNRVTSSADSNAVMQSLQMLVYEFVTRTLDDLKQHRPPPEHQPAAAALGAVSLDSLQRSHDDKIIFLLPRHFQTFFQYFTANNDDLLKTIMELLQPALDVHNRECFVKCAKPVTALSCCLLAQHKLQYAMANASYLLIFTTASLAQAQADKVCCTPD